jgi:hypothetical protein
MPRRLRLILILVLLVAGASACQVHTTVGVEVAADGSGTVDVTVSLDDEALARIPDADGDGVTGSGDLTALVRVDDLEAAGWTVVFLTAEESAGSDDAGSAPDGAVSVRASRAFGTPEEADRILAELTGSSGVLRDLRVTRRESFGRTELGFSGTADLSGGLEAFGDAGLAAALEGEPLGEDVAAIEARIGQPLADAFTVEIRSRLDDDETTWTPRLGDGPLDLAAASTRYDEPVLVLTGVAVVALVALVVLLLVRLIRGRRFAWHGG